MYLIEIINEMDEPVAHYTSCQISESSWIQSHFLYYVDIGTDLFFITVAQI